MPFGKLFAKQGNPRTTALQVIAKANGLDLEFIEADTSAPTIEHLKANPLGKIPAFVGEDGYVLSEAVAVAIYLTSQNEKTSLLGKTKQDYASILRWLSFFNTEILSPFGAWYRPILGLDPYNKKNVEEASKTALKAVGVVEEHLVRNTYLVGERITLADIFAASILSRGFEFFFDKEWRSNNPNTYRWFDTIVNQDIYTAVAGQREYLDTPKLTNVAPKKPEAPKPAPKAAPAAAAAAPAEDAPAPKPKHPLDALPKASIPLDEWKRQFSNNKLPDAMAWFWANINFEEYSIWKVDYKYNDELTLTFMSNNLIGGFNARLEASRKYLFGVASVFGTNNDNIIQGAFVIRGQDHLPVFDVAPDYESYTFTKLDPTKPEDRAQLEFQFDGEQSLVVDGKEYPAATGKVIK